MYAELFFQILTVIFAVFGLGMLVHLVVDDLAEPDDTVYAILYDGSFSTEELGRRINVMRRSYKGEGRIAVIVTSSLMPGEDIMQILREENIDIYVVK